MATGLIRVARRITVSTLRGGAGLTALVPAASIYGQRMEATPGWPYISLGDGRVAERIRANGVSSAVITFPLHVFAQALHSGGGVSKTADHHASDIGEQVEALLDDKRYALADITGTCRFTLSDTALMADKSPENFHWFTQVNARIIAA